MNTVTETGIATESIGLSSGAGGERESIPTGSRFDFRTLAEDERGQFGEVLQLFRILDYYGSENQFCAEIGAWDGVFLSNTLALRRRGWKALLVESDAEKAAQARELNEPDTVVVHAAATPANIDKMLDDAGAPKELDFLSIDIDSYDYHVWRGLLNYRPRIVMIETSTGPYQAGDYVTGYGEPIEEHPDANGGEHTRCCSRIAMHRLAADKGYVPMAVTRCNNIFVRRDVFESKGVRLNVGSGASCKPGYAMIDTKIGTEAYPLGVADGSVDEVYASHVLEHFSHKDTMKVLRDWVRVLKPNGRLTIAVPDFEAIANDKGSGETFNSIQNFVLGSHTDEFDKHGALFTKQSLTAQLNYVGIENVQPFQSDGMDCSHYNISLNLTGTKRSFVMKDSPNVVAVLSQPRIGFTSNFLSVHKALRCLGNLQRIEKAPKIADDIVYCGGAFWEKNLTAGIKHACSFTENGDYLLFCDYDTVCAPEDAMALIQMMQDDPSLSAAFAVQASRHNDKALVERDDVDYSGEQVQVQLGHFGLAVIRRQVFSTLPRPWLWSMPNPKTCEWDEPGHCDADITFWRILAEHGHKVVQANRVQVGHMDLCVKWVTPTGIMYQPIKHYERHGRPKQAVFGVKEDSGG